MDNRSVYLMIIIVIYFSIAYKVANVWEEFFNIASGIKSITKASSPDAIYDLQGRRMNGGGKGLYIVDGKKMLVK